MGETRSAVDIMIPGGRRVRESLSDALTWDPASRAKGWMPSCLQGAHLRRVHGPSTRPGRVIFQEDPGLVSSVSEEKAWREERGKGGRDQF